MNRDSMRSLNELKKLLPDLNGKTLFVAGGEDPVVMELLEKVSHSYAIEMVLMGDAGKIMEIIEKKGFHLPEVRVIQMETVTGMVQYVAKSYMAGNKCILMKGNVTTAELMREVIKRRHQLKGEGLLSHVALVESIKYHKVFCVTDSAMNINPDLKQKQGIIENAVKVMTKLGVVMPKVACLSAIEYVNPKIQSTVDAKLLTEMNEKGKIQNCLVYGPLAMDNIISKDAARAKKIESDVAGDADIILVPEIICGNMLYKALNYLADVKCASVITGANIPIVLTSRTDTAENRYYSLLLSCIV